MKVRLTGSEEDFKKLKVDTLDRNKFQSFRKPQTGGNPKYKPGGEKYNPAIGEQLLMYVDIDIDTVKKMFKPLRAAKTPLERLAAAKKKAATIKKTPVKKKTVTKKQPK